MTQYLKTDFGELKFYQIMLVNIWMGGIISEIIDNLKNLVI